MRTHSPALAAIVAILSMTANACLAESPPEKNFPSFHFSPGDVLAYELQSEFRHSDESLENDQKVTFWITEETKPRQWKCVVASETTLAQETGGKRDGNPEVRIELSELEVDRFGTPLAEAQAAPNSFFIVFPRQTDGALPQKWSYSLSEAEKTSVRVTKDSGSRMEFQTESSGLFRDIYGMVSEMTLVFDREAGRVISGEGKLRQDYGFKGEGWSKMKLVSFGHLSNAELENFRAEAEKYFDQKRDILPLYKNIDQKPAQTAAILDEISDKKKAALAGIHMAPFKKALEDSISEMDSRREYDLKKAKKFASVLNQSSPLWEARDLAGKDYKVEDFRGNVVLLDFWYRGCGWCMRAMPQIKEVASHYAGKPVKVIAMSTDNNPDDARFVADKMHLSYPTLLAHGINERYGVHGFPTLIVLDKNGVVRDFHIGYSPTLKEELVHTVDELLAK